LIAVGEAKIVRVEKDTFGGPTYYIRRKGFPKDQPLCFRKMKNQEGFHCTHPAGYRTDHPGTGACRFHGGAAKRPTISTGMHAIQTRKRLDDKIQEYLGKSRDDLLDLTEHLAATRAIFDDFMVYFPNPESEEYGLWFARFNSLIATLGTLVEKISRIDSRNTLTVAQVMYLRAVMIDVLLKYVPEPSERERVIREISMRMGGDLEIEMRPSEVSMPKFVDAEYADA